MSSLEIVHPLYGAGLIIDFDEQQRQTVFAFPGSLSVREEGSPAELILRFHRGQISVKD